MSIYIIKQIVIIIKNTSKMITIIAVTLVLAMSLIAALVSKFNTIAKLEKQIDDLGNKFNASYQSYNEFQRIYRELAEKYEGAYKVHSQSYKDIRETYTRLMDLLQEYTSCLPDNINAELKKIKDKEKKLKELQKQIIKDIEKNPNYDDATKSNLKEHILNPGHYGNEKINTMINIANKE